MSAKEKLLRQIYEEIESGRFFKDIAMQGDVREEDTDKQCGVFILNYIVTDADETVPVIIFALEDRYQISCPMYPGLLAEWIKAGDTGGYHGMTPLGEIGSDDYISRTKLHGSIKKSIVNNLPLYVPN